MQQSGFWSYHVMPYRYIFILIAAHPCNWCARH